MESRAAADECCGWILNGGRYVGIAARVRGKESGAMNQGHQSQQRLNQLNQTSTSHMRTTYTDGAVMSHKLWLVARRIGHLEAL